MSTILAPPKPPLKRERSLIFRLLIAFGGLAFLVTGWLLLQGLPGKPIVVSRSTTYITAPLRPDGLPDYEEHLLDKYRAGVTPENNAGVLLCQAIGPAGFELADYRLVCNELGLATIPSAEGALQELQSDELRTAVKAWLADRGIKVEGAVVDNNYLDDVLFDATDAAWTTSDLPPLAEWLDGNQKPLDLVVAATLRPHFYLPSPSLLNDQHEMLIDMLLPGVQSTRNAGRVLSVRAMHHLGEGRLDDTWNDTLALHRLAGLAGQTHTIVEKLVAIAMHGQANNATLAILSDDQLSLDLARQIQADLAKLDRRVSLRDTLGSIERISTLDSTIHTSIDGFEVLGDEPIAPGTGNRPSTVDWNIVLADINYWYDRLEQAIAHADYEERQQAIDRYEANLDESARDIKHPFTLVKAYFSRKARSQAIASIFSNLLLPPVSAAIAAEDRNQAMLQLIDVAAALAVYRAKHGQYPKTLAELTPDLFPQAPTDPIRFQELVYKPESTGYLLYSLGPNGIDDGGSSEQYGGGVLAGRQLEWNDDKTIEALRQTIPTGADDYSIRVPIPRFKLRTPPTQP